MSAKQAFILKREIAGGGSPYLLKLNRVESSLEVFKRCGNEKLYNDLIIRKTYNSDSYTTFEKELSFPCIFGGEVTPTPVGIFHIEEKSENEYISSYYPAYKQVKFFGYLVVFEDYFIHSDLYTVDETEPIADKIISRNDKTTAGCIRISQENLSWLIENIDVGTLVVL